jgi:hypothetical protein
MLFKKLTRTMKKKKKRFIIHAPVQIAILQTRRLQLRASPMTDLLTHSTKSSKKRWLRLTVEW